MDVIANINKTWMVTLNLMSLRSSQEIHYPSSYENVTQEHRVLQDDTDPYLLSKCSALSVMLWPAIFSKNFL